MKQIIQVEDLGRMPYQAAWEHQTALHRALVERKLQHRGLPPRSFSQDHRLLLVEHPPVYTLGRSGSTDNLLLSTEELAQQGIEFFPINRGGDITFHGPGQLVGYPILDLEHFFTDVHRYVRCIEEVIIRTLAEYDLEGIRVEGYTGVWLPPTARDHRYRKICAIGVHLSRWVTLHGFAFNINTPLHYFDYIVPCGIADDDKAVASLDQELGHPVDLQMVKKQVTAHFCATFDCTINNFPVSSLPSI
jgi:lipoyl(octanoyl) transferase